MARLDRAIHEKSNALSMLLDGRVKPGHDSGALTRFLHTLLRANDNAPVAINVRWYNARLAPARQVHTRYRSASDTAPNRMPQMANAMRAAKSCQE